MIRPLLLEPGSIALLIKNDPDDYSLFCIGPTFSHCFNLFSAGLNADLDPFSFVEVLIQLNNTCANLNTFLIHWLYCADMNESRSVENTGLLGKLASTHFLVVINSN